MQDSKNLIIAIILCLLVVIGWSQLADKMGWVHKPTPEQVEMAQQQQQEALERQQAAEAAREIARANPLPVFQESEGRDLVIKTPLYTATLYTGGGILRSFELKNFRQAVAADSAHVNLVSPQTASVAPLGLLVNGQPSWSIGRWGIDQEGDIEITEGQRKVVTLTGMVGGLRVVRELAFDGASYDIAEKVRVTPAGEQPVFVKIGYTVGADSSNAGGGQYDSMRVGWDDNGKLQEEADADKLTTGVMNTGRIYWAGAMSTYFFSGIMPGTPDEVTVKGVFQNNVYRAALEQAETTAMPGQEVVYDATYWFGPKDRKLMNACSEELGKSVDLGMFSVIAKGLLWILDFFYGYVGNWGVAIIMLTIVIKAIFWPLTAKSYSSMEKMKRLAPMMQKIKEKHAGDKEAMNRETMALYKTYGVNPASGCIPILIQMPVFFGLYQALLTSIELRHAPFIPTLPFTDFVWLADLSARDPYYITPIVMGLSMLVMQKLSPPAADSRQQKIMMLLPVVFTFLFLGFPSGLVVYWLVNNIISIGQQWMMTHKTSKELNAK